MINENKIKIKKQDVMLKNIEKSFTNEKYDTSILENNKIQIIKYENILIALTTVEYQKNNNNINITNINLGKCEDKLIEVYNITDEILYMKKIDSYQEGWKIPKTEFDVYCRLNGTNLVKLNLSYCQDIKYNLSVFVNITGNLDELNISSGYYNDVCYPVTTDFGTDIILKDRRDEFIKNNKSVCQDGCDFIDYNYTSKKVICSCNVKESSISSEYMNINITELYKKFKDFENIANIKILSCYKVLFSKKGIKKKHWIFYYNTF